MRPHLLLLVLLCIPLAVAQGVTEHQVIYTIVADTVVVEEKIIFTAPLTLTLPDDTEALEVEGGTFTRDQNKLTIRGSGEVRVTYITEAFIEKTKDRFFLLDTSRFLGENSTIKVILPENAVLKYPLGNSPPAVLPAPSKVETNGQQLALIWDKDALEGALMIIYDVPGEVTPWMWGGVILLLSIGVGILFYIRNRSLMLEKKLTPKVTSSSPAADLTRNLFEEERVIVETLLKEGELWQKQLLFKTGISAVKLSRKLRHLEAKGLIEKVPFGNTNKIRLKKA